MLPLTLTSTVIQCTHQTTSCHLEAGPRDDSCLPCGPHFFFAFPAHNSFQIYSLHMLKELNSIFLIYLLRKSIILYHLPTVSHIVMRRIDVQMSLSLFFCLAQVKCWSFQCLWAYIILRYIVSCTPLIIAGMFCLTNLPIYISCIPFCG